MNEKKIIDYKMATASNTIELSGEIKALISDGYTPYGSPFYTTTRGFYCQAMVKYGSYNPFEGAI